MPVSLERLIAEVEPAVVTDELIRDCIVVSTMCLSSKNPFRSARTPYHCQLQPLACKGISWHESAVHRQHTISVQH